MLTFNGYLELVHPDDPEIVTRKLNQAIATKEEIVFGEKIVHSDGDIESLKSWCKVIVDENEEVVEMVGASLDISKLRKNTENCWVKRVTSMCFTQWTGLNGCVKSYWTC